MFFLFTLVIYGLGLVLTAVGGRLTGRCATWCCALCGLPLWVVSGTVASLCRSLRWHFWRQGWASRGWLWARRWPAQ